MSEVNWQKDGPRTLWSASADHNAIIFGAAKPRQIWAWAVWANQGNAEGIEFSLKRARLMANSKIKELAR